MITWASLKIILSNHGKTPAILKKNINFIFLSSSTPVLIDHILRNAENVPNGLVLAAGDSKEYTINFNGDEGDLTQIELGNCSLFVVGKVVYDDVLGKERMAQYCWKVIYIKPRYRIEIVSGTPLNTWT